MSVDSVIAPFESMLCHVSISIAFGSSEHPPPQLSAHIFVFRCLNADLKIVVHLSHPWFHLPLGNDGQSTRAVARRRRKDTFCRLRADRDVVLAAVQQDGRALRFATDELRADREVLAAIQQDV